jgi:hypothetical protein
MGLGYGEKVVEEEDYSNEELRSSPTPSKKSNGTSLSKSDRLSKRF